MVSRLILAGCAALLVLHVASPAAAQQFPSRTIRLTVPAAPGGSTDVIARVLARSMTEQTGQSVIVDNRAGASGAIGVSSVVQSQPDGYTILFATIDPISVVPAVRRTVPYSVEKDLVPITMVGEAPFVFAVNSKLPVSSMKDFLALASSKPGAIKYASAGLGTSAHLIMEVLKLRTGADLLHVPYKGVGPSMQALIAGEVDILATTPASLKPHIANGSLKALATAAATRSAVLPDVPTTSEAGLKDMVISAWWGAFLPANVPAAVADQLDAIFRRAMASPEYQKTLATLAIDGNALSRDAFGKFVAEDTARWRDVVQRAKISLEE